MFEKLNTKKLNYKASELLKNPQKGFIPALTAGSQNQGLNCYVPKSEATILKNVISLSANGDGIAFFQSGEFTILQDAYAIDFICKPNKISNNHYLFIVGAINKIIGKYNWNNKSGWNRVKDDKIKLPIKDENLGDDLENIDFKFMEDFIAELEAQRIAELEAYLITTNLKDYNLTTDEKQALKDFENLELGEFKIGDLYKKAGLKKAKFDKSSDTSQIQDEIYSLPLVNAKHGNNGIMFYGKESIFPFVEMTIDIVQNGAVATGDVYPQPQKTGILWDAYLIKATKRKDTRQTLFYFACAIEKSIKLKYCYEFKATWNRVKNEKIQLPVQNGEINYKFMQNFIKAIEKLVIKDVVDFADEKISLTKKCIKTPCETK